MLNIVYIAIGIIVPILFYLYRKDWLAYYLIAVSMLSEFFYIDIAGGKVRFYHLAAIVIVILLYKQWKNILVKREIWIIAIFVIYAFISACISSSRIGAVKSWISLVLNASVGVALLLVLEAKYIDVRKLKQAICYATIVSCVFGIMQYLMFFVFNINIGFSVEQRAQINIGMIPSFRTEANVIGRVLIIVMFLLLPELMNVERKIRGLKLMYLLAMFCTMINATRTVLYPACIVFVVLGVYYWKMGQARRFLQITGATAGVIVIIVIAVWAHILPAADYTIYKWNAFVSPIKIDVNVIAGESDSESADKSKEQTEESVNRNEAHAVISTTEESANENEKYVLKEITEEKYDISASYRASSTKRVLMDVLKSPKTIIFGRGWGQTYYTISNEKIQAGTGDWFNIFAYTGIIGLVLYLFMTVNVLRITVMSMVKKEENGRLALGVLSSCVIIGIAGLLSSNIIQPEFWMLVGLGAYLEGKRGK